MNILIVFDSESGNTKKVVGQVKTQLEEENYSVKVKHALTATEFDITDSDLLIIGTPVHGWILLNQKPTKTVRKFLKKEIPDSLQGKPVIGFCTYLFFPASTLKKIGKVIEHKNGKILDLLAERRNNKTKLVTAIVNVAKKEFTNYRNNSADF